MVLGYLEMPAWVLVAESFLGNRKQLVPHLTIENEHFSWLEL